MLSGIRVWFPRVAALALAACAVVWFWSFGLTDFRAHQRVPMLAIAALTLGYAVLLVLGKSWAVVSSVVLSLLIVAAVVYLQASRGFFNLALATIAVVLLGYSIGLGFALKSKHSKGGC